MISLFTCTKTSGLPIHAIMLTSSITIGEFVAAIRWMRKKKCLLEKRLLHCFADIDRKEGIRLNITIKAVNVYIHDLFHGDSIPLDGHYGIQYVRNSTLMLY